MEKLKKLQFVMSLMDRVSGPLNKIQQRFDKFTKNWKVGLASLGVGMAMLTTSGYAAAKALEPARDIALKIGEVASLDVPIDELNRLESTALQASTKYGTAAADFVGASYDIQSAISGLEPGQLGEVTNSMNALAIGTKSNVADMTSLMGSMYGIFEDQAKGMGVDKFSQQVAAYTAKSVQMFKTTGKAMEDSFRGIGSLAKTHGISMQEQFAILGSLQATMPGAEAGTKYKAFLAGVMKSQKKLGLQFTDSQGKMLPMVAILEKIKGKYGDLDSIEIASLSKAFGSEEAVMVLTDLIGKTDKLKGSIKDVGNADFTLVEKMAQAIADPWAKAGKGISSVTAKLGGFFLPTVNKGMEIVAGFSSKILTWVDANPKLAATLTKVVTGVFAVVAVLSTLAIVFGVLALASAGFGAAMAILFSPVTLVVGAVAALAAGAIYLYTHWEQIKDSLSQSEWGQILLGIIDVVTTPIRALIEVVSTLYNHWDKVKIALSDSVWGTVLVTVIDSITFPFRTLIGLFTNTEATWKKVTGALGNTEWGNKLLGMINKLKAPLKNLLGKFDKLKSGISSKWSGFKAKIGITPDDSPINGGARALGGAANANHFYRINERGPEIMEYQNASYLIMGGVNGNIIPFPTADNQHLQAARQSLRPRERSSSGNSGGLSQLISYQTQNNQHSRKQSGNTKSIRIGELHVHTTKKIDVDEFEALLDMAG